MKCSVKANEQMGFLAFMMSERPQSEEQKMLHALLENTDEQAEQNGSTTLSANLLRNLPKMKSMDDIKKFIMEYYGEDKESAEKLVEQTDRVYPEYHKMYEEKQPALDKYVTQMNKELNEKGGAVEYLERVSKFFGWDIPKDHMTIGVVYPSYTSDGCSLTKEGGTYQAVGLVNDQYNPENKHEWNRQKAKWVHESIHGLFEESGSEKQLLDYLRQPENSVVNFMIEHPEFKRSAKETPLESARALFDESMTTALQGMFERENLGENRDVLYHNPIYNIMAHKLMGIFSQMMQEGKTFGPDFIKQFEQEFFDSKTQEKMKEEIKNRKCREGVQEYLKQQYEKMDKTFPKDFFARKGQPNYSEQHFQIANELLEEFKKRTDSSFVMDEKFFQEFEKNNPKIKNKVSDMIAGKQIEPVKADDRISTVLEASQKSLRPTITPEQILAKQQEAIGQK